MVGHFLLAHVSIRTAIGIIVIQPVERERRQVMEDGNELGSVYRNRKDRMTGNQLWTGTRQMGK